MKDYRLRGVGTLKSSSLMTSPARRRRVRCGLALLLLALCFFLTSLPPSMAADGDLDPSFNPGTGVSSSPMLWGRINYTDSSGKMMIAGSFRQIAGGNRTCLARLFGDGSLDDTFNAAITNDSNNVNNCMLLSPGDPNSQMLICGEFAIPSNSGTYYGLARLNHDGTVDSGFTHTFAAFEGVMTMTRQADGKLYVGGTAMQVNGYNNTSFYLLRLDANGNVDTNYPMRSGTGGNIQGIWPDQNLAGQIRIVGDIPRFSDPTHWDHMLLLGTDGTTVLQSIGDAVVNGTILNWVYQGSNLIICGAFSKVFDSGTGTWKQMQGIARLLPGGGIDPNFLIGTGANGHVKRVTIVGSQMMLNGYFTSFNGTPCGFLVYLNTNGSVANTFGTGADDRIWNAFRQDDGTWTLMGAFQSFNGSPRQGLASLASDGSIRDQFALFTVGFQPTTNKVYAMQGTPQGLYIAGAMSRYGGKLHQRMARLTFEGGPDQTFLAGLAGVVYTLDIQVTDWKVLVAGHFGTGTGYVGCTSVARLNTDGTMDLGFHPLLAKADGTLPDIYLMQDAWDTSGHINVGGNFASVNGVARSGIARLNSDGTLDTTFTFNPASMPGLTNIVMTHADDDEGGPFKVAGKATYNGATCGFLARLLHDGSLDTSFANGPSPVPHVVIFDGEIKGGASEESTGRLTLGGEFTHILDGANNPQRNRLARFSANGILDPTYTPAGPDGPIYAMTGQYPGDKVLIGGVFTAYNGVARKNLARLKADGSLDPSFDPGDGPNDAVYVIQYDSYNRRALIGGAFTTYAGVNRSRIAGVVATNVSFNPAIPLLLLFD
jgi:uncharacterized delta-60 repeat protein